MARRARRGVDVVSQINVSKQPEAFNAVRFARLRVPAVWLAAGSMTTDTACNSLIDRGRRTPMQRQRALLLLVVLAGILCRVAQYMANPSLWHDEALVALNVMDRT